MAARKILSRWGGAGLCAALAIASAFADPIPFAQVPPVVQKGIQAQVGSGTLGAVERDEEDGEVTFTAEISKGGRARGYTLNEAGVLVSMEVLLMETPLPVQRTIGSIVGMQGKIESIDKEFDESEVLYDVEWTTKAGVTRSFSVLENGKLESTQIDLDGTPPPVKAAILAEAGKGQVKEIFQSIEDNALFFDVTVNRDGKNREFTVTQAGKLDSRQLFLNELSPAAQSAIQRTIGQGKLVRIDEIFEKKKGVVPYEVESIVDGKPYGFSIGPNGRFLGVDQ
jgi:hypothetical protein